MNNIYKNIPSTPIIFLDLDHTLINKDTNSIWLEWRIKHKKDYKGIPELLIGLHNSHYYKKGKLTAKKMNIYFWARTLGINSHEYSALSKSNFYEKGVQHIFPDAIKLIEYLKQKCEFLVMITGQDEYLSYPYFKFFNLHDLIANKRIIRNNKFIGFESPNCYAEGKIVLANNYASIKGYTLNDCAFFTDSISDLPLLNAVKYPVAVNPDKELHKNAVANKWPIINFSM